MSVLVLKNVQVLLGPCAPGNDCLSGLPAYDVSEWVTGVTLSTTHDIFETTQVNDTAKKRVPGLADNTVAVEFNQDFGSGITDLEYVMNQPGANSLIGTIGRMLIRPNNAATSAGNPQYYFEVVFSEWQPLSGRVGDISTVQVTWPVNGVINKSYS